MEPFKIEVYSVNNLSFDVQRWLPAFAFQSNNLEKVQRISLNESATILAIGRSVRGCIDTASLFIEPRSYQKDLAVPNAFTPNGDGLNDVFRPKLLLERAYSTVEFNIYNRYGQLIHSTANMNSGWDGTSKGAPADQGVYYYSIKILFLDNTSTQLNGEVTLIR